MQATVRPQSKIIRQGQIWTEPKNCTQDLHSTFADCLSPFHAKVPFIPHQSRTPYPLPLSTPPFLFLSHSTPRHRHSSTLWLSFQRSSTTHMRRTSVSLPSTTTSTKNIAHDPFEKPARYNSKGAKDSAASTLENIKAGWMTQSQRSRYLKTGGILLFVLFLFYYLSPSGTHVASTGRLILEFIATSRILTSLR